MARPLHGSQVARRPHASSRGTSLLEMMFTVGVLATLTALAVPNVTRGRDLLAVEGAARYIGSRIRLARGEAARRGAAVGLVFDRVGAVYRESMVLDGNDNGIRRADIRRGLDPPLDEEETLSARFPGVRFGLSGGVPPIGSNRPADEGSDPIRLGAGDVLTMTPIGTGTSGTLYLRSRAGAQYAVRVLGATGRVRVLSYEPSTGAWQER